MMRFRTAFVLGSLAATSVTVAACHGEALPGAGVMVVMRTDMTVPATVTSVGLYIDRILDGKTTSLLAREVETAVQPNGDTQVSLPSNFAIQGTGKADSSVVRVRVVAYHLETILAVREARAGIPQDRLAELGMPMLWMNTDEVTQSTDAEGNVQFASTTCPADQTLGNDGSCEPVLVADLPTYEAPPEPTAVEAGACDPSCFDVSECFKPESVEDPDEDFKAARAAIGWFDDAHTQCGVPLGARGELARQNPDRIAQLAERLAVAVRVDPGEGASCTKQDPSQCFIVIDAATKLDVATKLTDQGERLWARLPAGICRKWQAGRIVGDTAVAVPGCKRKGADQPLCVGSQVGCTTDEGWDGRKNPRAGQDRDAGPGFCAVPGATAVWASATEVLAITQGGQVVSVPQVLGNCVPTPIGGPMTAGTFRFADAVGGTVAFMNLDTGLAGTIARGDAGDTVSIPAAVVGDDAPWGVGFARGTTGSAAVYLGQSGGFVEGGGAITLLPAQRDFTQITNGVDDGALGTRFVVGNGSKLTVLGAHALAAAERGTFDTTAVPLHAAALGTSLYVLTGAGTALTPGLVHFADQTDSAELVLAPAAPFGSLPREMPLASSARALFFGDLDGHVYRVAPKAGAGPTAAELALEGLDPVHSVYYAGAPVPGTDIEGFLYLVTWPGNDPTRAQLLRKSLRADGSVIPDPDGGTEPDASGSSSGESSSSSSSTGGSTSGGPIVDDAGETIDAAEPLDHADVGAQQPL